MENLEEVSRKNEQEKEEEQIPSLENGGLGPIIIEQDEKEVIKYKEEKENELRKRLAYYGITREEWEAVEKYKSSGYFIITTLLHRIDLFEYNYPAYGELYEHIELTNPEQAIETFSKIYSVMCKFAKRNNRDLQIKRVGSDLFYKEMKTTGKTESFLSFSNGEYHWGFANDKNGVILLTGTLAKGLPCIAFSEIEGEDAENEILLPPFLTINYSENAENYDEMYPEYGIQISKEKGQRLSDEDKERMEMLRQSIIGKNIPCEYYEHWYTTRANPSNHGKDEKSEQLREEFFKWQDAFKEYLQLRFREIEYEINYPKVKPMNFLSWGIEREKSRTFRDAMHHIRNFFEQIINPSKEDKYDRGE